ncbi:MAG: hypothetical protein KIT49_10335 [Nitrospira sp.]|nr:hypothetical protein [Nitrospira sp.]
MIVIATLFSATSAASQTMDNPELSEEQYLCIPDKVTGFAFDTHLRKWEIAAFDSEKKYLVSVGTLNPLGLKTSKVAEIGSVLSMATCGSGFNESGYLFCSGFVDFRFNKNNGRFISVYMHGYLSEDNTKGKSGDNGSFDTPYMQIGKCSRL